MRAVFALILFSLTTLGHGQTTPTVSVIFNPTLLGSPTRPHIGGVATISVLDHELDGADAELINIDACSGTTLARSCTDAEDCGIFGVIVTATNVIHSTAYEITSVGTLVDGSGPTAQSRPRNVTGTCDYHGPTSAFTEAVCTTIIVEVLQNITTTYAPETTTNTDTWMLSGGQVTIIDGGGLLGMASPTCSSQSTASSGSNAEATAVVEVHKVLVPVGAALMAGALMI